MCVAIPGKVIEILEGRAKVEQNGAVHEVSIIAVPDIMVGSYVLVNLGVAAKVLTDEHAREIVELWDQLNTSFSMKL